MHLLFTFLQQRCIFFMLLYFFFGKLLADVFLLMSADICFEVLAFRLLSLRAPQLKSLPCFHTSVGFTGLSSSEQSELGLRNTAK